MAVTPSQPITVLHEDVDGECPTCGFDSLRKLTGYRLTEDGVTTVYSKIICGRCLADEKRKRNGS